METYWEGPKYANRREAGLVLARGLAPYRSSHPTVLAVPNGGVAVGLPIARAFCRRLYLILVRKLQIPTQPEAGFGAVASHGGLVLNEPLVRKLDLTEEVIAVQKERSLRSLQARMMRYGGLAEFPTLNGRVVILVDDGLASGLTMEAAVKVVKRHRPAKVVVAVPTSSMGAFRRLSTLVDKVVCPDVSRLPIFAVADAYEDWRDVRDEEVIALLRSSAPAGAEAAGSSCS